MKISIRRAIVASATAVTAAAIAFTAPAAAFAAPPQVIHDEGGVAVVFNDVHDRTDDVIENVVDDVNEIVPVGAVKFKDIRGPRSAVAWNPNPTFLIECTHEEEASGLYVCWEILDD